MCLTISCVVIALCILCPASSQPQESRGVEGCVPSDSFTHKMVPQASQVQIDEYNLQLPKTIIELQQFRENNSIGIVNSPGQNGKATLTNLKPMVNTWFLLTVDWGDGEGAETYHLENPDPINQMITLDPDFPQGIVIVDGKQKFNCALWSESLQPELREGRNSNKPYTPLCNGRLYLRNKTKGHKTTMEWATDFLRNYIVAGEKITVFIREQFFQDAFLSTSEIVSGLKKSIGIASPRPPGTPTRPLINQHYKDHFLIAEELGIDLENEIGHKALIGRWYPVKHLSGVFVSVIQPQVVSEEVIQSQKKQVNSLDDIESAALSYMIAFDLDQFEFGFALGTEHPRVDWSDRVHQSVRDNCSPGSRWYRNGRSHSQHRDDHSLQRKTGRRYFYRRFQTLSRGFPILRFCIQEPWQPLWLYRKRDCIQQITARFSNCNHTQ